MPGCLARLQQLQPHLIDIGDTGVLDYTTPRMRSEATLLCSAPHRAHGSLAGDIGCTLTRRLGEVPIQSIRLPHGNVALLVLPMLSWNGQALLTN